MASGVVGKGGCVTLGEAGRGTSCVLVNAPAAACDFGAGVAGAARTSEGEATGVGDGEVTAAGAGGGEGTSGSCRCGDSRRWTRCRYIQVWCRRYGFSLLCAEQRRDRFDRCPRRYRLHGRHDCRRCRFHRWRGRCAGWWCSGGDWRCCHGSIVNAGNQMQGCASRSGSRGHSCHRYLSGGNRRRDQRHLRGSG